MRRSTCVSEIDKRIPSTSVKTRCFRVTASRACTAAPVATGVWCEVLALPRPHLLSSMPRSKSNLAMKLEFESLVLPLRTSSPAWVHREGGDSFVQLPLSPFPT